MINKIRSVKSVPQGYRNFSVEYDPVLCQFRVIFVDHTGVYQSFENGKKLVFANRSLARTYASRFNSKYRSVER